MCLNAMYVVYVFCLPICKRLQRHLAICFLASAEYQLPFTPLLILICLSFYQITKLYTFLDYVMGGCQINFTVSDT